MYRLNDEQREIVEKFRLVGERAIAPHAERIDREGRFPGESVAALGAEGLLGLTVPKDAGGMGQNLRTAVAILDELAQRCPSTAMIYLMRLCGIACYVSAPDRTAAYLN